MKNIILLHDAFANPTNYWYQNIPAVLPNGYSLITPELSAGAQQGMEYWLEDLQKYKEIINADTVIISHGISSLLMARLLETLGQPVRIAISIAGCAETPAHQALAPVAETFLQTPFNWEVIKKNTSSVVHIWNKADPFVNPELSIQFAELFSGKTYPLTGLEHFTDTSEPELMSVLQGIFKELEGADVVAATVQAQAAQQAQLEQLAKSSIPSVVTYDTDVAQSVAGYQGNVISELLHEARVREADQQQASPKNPRNILYVIGSAILIFAGIGAIGYGLSLKVPTIIQRIQTVDTQYASSLIRVETITPLQLTGVVDFQLKKQFKELQTAEIEERTFSSIVPLNGAQRAPLQNFADALLLQLPVGFASKTNDYVYGYYRPQGQVQAPFLLISFDGYDLMYSVMRNWEDDIAHQLSPLLLPKKESLTLVKSEKPLFIDTIVNNIPMRIATLSDGSTVSYGFLTDQVLLITTSSDIAEPLLRRIVGR